MVFKFLFPRHNRLLFEGTVNSPKRLPPEMRAYPTARRVSTKDQRKLDAGSRTKVRAYKIERHAPGRLMQTRTPTLPRDPCSNLTPARGAVGTELPEKVATTKLMIKHITKQFQSPRTLQHQRYTGGVVGYLTDPGPWTNYRVLDDPQTTGRTPSYWTNPNN